MATLLILLGSACAQDAPITPDSFSMIGGPQDWSNRHVIFTRNGSTEDMLQLSHDPRFFHSILQRYINEHRSEIGQTGANRNLLGEAEINENREGQEQLDFNPVAPWKPIPPISVLRRSKRPKVDWSISLGPTGGVAYGETPAIYTANYSSPSCANDFAVYTINATPSTTVAASQANLIAFNNLYTSPAGSGFCTGTGPSVMFSYAIGTGASALSPVLSLDGTRVAWIENVSATSSNLHVTIWAANQGATATAPVAVNGTFSNGACTTSGQSCDFSLNYTNAAYSGCSKKAAGNSHSDLYVDYNSNTGFISANNGNLYHIKNIFSTTASPSVDFCINVNNTIFTTPNAAMSGPVYDPILGEVFITDSEKVYAYTVGATAFTLSSSYTYGSSYNYPTGPGPYVDMFNGYVYVFSTDDINGHTSVTQLPTSLASGTIVQLGPKSTNTIPMLFYGAFDNNYYTFGPKSTKSTLYSCGTDATTTTTQDLFAISFNSSTGVVNTTPAMSSNKNINPGGTGGPGVLNGVCSPLTEFYDGINDRLFVGMGQPGASTGANVVTMWNINTQLTSASTTPTASTTATYLGGTSGIAADNNSTDAQAESIYFSTEQLGTASTNVGATTAYNVNGIYTDGSTFPQTGGLDDDGNAYSSTQLGTTVTWNGTTFTLGTANALDAWQATTITLPAGQYSTLMFLGNAVNGNLASQTFTVTYTDNSTTTYTQSVSDWFTPQSYPGESIAKTTTYRNVYNGTKDNRTFDLFGYSFAINPNKTVKTLTLPPVASGTTDNVVVVLAIALSSNCGGADYCAVKLTQSGLQ